MRRKNKLILFSVLCVSALWFPVAVKAQATVTAINSYTREIDRYIKTQKQGRIFAEVLPETEGGPTKWQEFKTEKALEDVNTVTTAELWSRENKIVRADFMFTSQSGDWAHFITYYFRDDGSLAKLEGQLNTFYGDVSIVRDQYFNARGKVLHSTKKFLDLQTQKPKKPPRDFYDNPVTLFRRASSFPFHKLL